MKISIALTISVLTLAAGVSTARAQSSTKDVTLIGSNRVAAAFAKGMPLLETSEFKIHASRRDAPGVAEIHTRDTDIVHVLEGSATFVTGGTATEPKTIAPNEIRGRDIQGGESRRISKGDVIVVPNGVPHWFKQVDGPLLYYVVKVTSASDGSK
jgi:glc operon protein GlcG